MFLPHMLLLRSKMGSYARERRSRWTIKKKVRRQNKEREKKGVVELYETGIYIDERRQ